LIEAARRSWFDTAAAMAAGAVENCTHAALASCGDSRLSVTDAALVLGTASHALDYDDVCMLATCHPSAPAVAALLALVPSLQKLSWGELLAAYAVGTETTLRLGEWLGFRHYDLGFHATSTLGTIGVAAAAAHAMCLPPAQAHAALAIAASTACGLRANFGTDTKPLHVGFAAAGGLRAALLARAGAGASDDVWASAGFPRAFNGGEALPPLAWRDDTPWALLQPGFEHKRFPSCYMTHRFIAGVLEIRKRQAVSQHKQSVHITIEVAHNGTSALKYPHPRTGLQGKFSGPYCAAAAWCDGQVTLASFTDAAVLRASLQDPTQRVVVREREQAGESLDTAPVHVMVEGEGWSDRITVDWAPGSLANPMTRADLLDKWRDCARHATLADADADADGPALALLDAAVDTPASELLEPVRELVLTAIARPPQKPGDKT
jgi:2-methylcitrate dehydratase PrpD